MDLISTVLVGLPMVVSLMLLGLLGLMPASLRPQTTDAMRLVTFVVSLVLFVVTTAMALGSLGDINWLGIGFNEYVLEFQYPWICLLYTSPSPRDYAASRMPSSA